MPEQHSADAWQVEPTPRQHRPALHERPAQQPAPHGWPAVLHEAHRPPLQEPEQHCVVAEHVLFVGEQQAPLAHDWPAWQTAHVTPPAPQAMVLCCGGSTQVLPWQQP